MRVLLIGAALAIAACASTPAPKTAAAQPPAKSPLCVASASRLPPTKDDCSQSGQSYSQTDVGRTGIVNPGGALRNLDSSIMTR
jgi:hypothetical protein